jgi:hypothetical protein
MLGSAHAITEKAHVAMRANRSECVPLSTGLPIVMWFTYTTLCTAAGLFQSFLMSNINDSLLHPLHYHNLSGLYIHSIGHSLISRIIDLYCESLLFDQASLCSEPIKLPRHSVKCLNSYTESLIDTQIEAYWLESEIKDKNDLHFCPTLTQSRMWPYAVWATGWQVLANWWGRGKYLECCMVTDYRWARRGLMATEHTTHFHCDSPSSEQSMRTHRVKCLPVLSSGARAALLCPNGAN